MVENPVCQMRQAAVVEVWRRRGSKAGRKVGLLCATEMEKRKGSAMTHAPPGGAKGTI